MSEKVGIVGSRGYKPLSDVEEFVRSLPPGTTVVSGTEPKPARDYDRVDERAIRTARECGLPTIVHTPKWRGADGRGDYWPGAGLARNTLIVRDSDRIVAFYDGQSDGTADTIEKAERVGKPVDVRVRIPQPQDREDNP